MLFTGKNHEVLTEDGIPVLCNDEAANLMISDLSVPRDAVTGKLLLESGLPKVVVVHIRRSKTDQTGQSYIVELHG